MKRLLFILTCISVQAYSQSVTHFLLSGASSEAPPPDSVVVGDSTIHDQYDIAYKNYLYANKIPMTTKGSVQYLRHYTGVSNSANLRCALYSHSVATNRPDSLIDSTAILTSVADSTWKTFDFSANPDVQRDTVWVAIWGSQNFYIHALWTGDAWLKGVYSPSNTYGNAWPVTFTTDGTFQTLRSVSCYMVVIE